MRLKHDLALRTTDAGTIEAFCTETGHDWAETLTTPAQMAFAELNHEHDVRGSLVPGLYVQDKGGDSTPRIYALRPDKTWRVVSYWEKAREPELKDLAFVGPVEADLSSLR